MTTFLTLFSSISFFAYGIGCFTSGYMRREFQRYGLPKHRKLTGFLEIAGATGLLTGLFIPVLGMLAAFGLALLMLLGFLVRIKIRDGFLKSCPALLYFILNAYLFQTHFTSNPITP